ncbi:hypothetical protein SASPL_157287 [Salvia splendens]|uniref:ABC transporter domain-containing protein n=1 Tax=Salvia splendens TaxID=180675 RepID=A0A8X8YVQ4_SALSN|nr:hypothetical protein SASPL_157287 [Salvia splendens]
MKWCKIEMQKIYNAVLEELGALGNSLAGLLDDGIGVIFDRASEVVVVPHLTALFTADRIHDISLITSLRVRWRAWSPRVAHARPPPPVRRRRDARAPGARDQRGVGTRSILFVLSFTNITYSVKVRRKLALPNLRRRPATDPELGFSSAKTILNNVSGEARDGEIMAVMGASGSEKSTLIDALANRMAKGSVKGSITLNGEQLESRMLKVISAYVMQDDLLFPMLTVEETLMFCREHCQSQRKSSSCKP